MTFDAWMVAQLSKLEERNAPVLDTVARLFLDRIAAGGVLFTAGAGHSLAAVCETFYRAGGLACIRPLYDRSLLPLEGARLSTVAERSSGLAAKLVESVGPERSDAVIVFSNSGANPYPVEVAAEFRDRGLPVVAVSSRAAMEKAPERAGRKLADLADHLLDTGVPPGDAAYPLGAPRTAGLSSLTNAFLWNLLLARTFDAADATGVDLPLWRSSNVEGGDEVNRALMEHYTSRIPELLKGVT